jgi:uncharacterized membrane protein
MNFTQLMELVTKTFELAGVAVLVVGFIYAFGRWVLLLARHESQTTTYIALRNGLGATILLALEILVSADIVRTLAVAPTIQNVAVLGLIVLIRTFLSFSLEIEIDGMLPWRKAGLKSQGIESTAEAPPAMPKS